MDNPEKKAGRHETDGCLRRDTRMASPEAVEIGNIPGLPGKIEHPVDAGKNMIARHKGTQRSADEKLELISVSDDQSS